MCTSGREDPRGREEAVAPDTSAATPKRPTHRRRHRTPPRPTSPRTRAHRRTPGPIDAATEPEAPTPADQRDTDEIPTGHRRRGALLDGDGGPRGPARPAPAAGDRERPPARGAADARPGVTASTAPPGSHRRSGRPDPRRRPARPGRGRRGVGSRASSWTPTGTSRRWHRSRPTRWCGRRSRTGSPLAIVDGLNVQELTTQATDAVAGLDLPPLVSSAVQSLRAPLEDAITSFVRKTVYEVRQLGRVRRHLGGGEPGRARADRRDAAR